MKNIMNNPINQHTTHASAPANQPLFILEEDQLKAMIKSLGIQEYPY